MSKIIFVTLFSNSSKTFPYVFDYIITNNAIRFFVKTMFGLVGKFVYAKNIRDNCQYVDITILINLRLNISYVCI